MMRSFWLIPWLAGSFASVKAESPTTPPDFKVQRFEESYSHLADPAKHNDVLDAIKYIPLRTGEPDFYLTLGGELRERFERVDNPDFGISASHDAFWLQRATLHADLHLGARVRIFVQGISGLTGGESLPAPPPQDDPIDLQSAFVDIVPNLSDDEKLTVRAGRFGLSFGSGRLVSTRQGPNIPFKFDGFELLYSRPLWQATAFLANPVREDSEKFDGSDLSVGFWGLYVTHWFDAPHKSGVDLFYLGIEREHGAYASGMSSELRHSFGTRLFGKLDSWDWNGEAVVQSGTFGDETIFAWTANLDTGYTWNTAWQPRMGLRVDVASGDDHPGDGRQETFDALYFKSADFTDASFLRPSNLINVHPNLGVNLSRAISLNGGVHVFWRYSRSDAVYSPEGFIQIPANDTGTSYLGTALDLNLQWQIQKHVSLGASYVHFFAGGYVHAAQGRDGDYVSTTLSFIF